MEVGGKIADTTRDAELCQPCGDAGHYVIAVKFCSVCKEWLCRSCTDYHRRLRALKSHTLFDKDELPVTNQNHGQENTTKYCETHPKELLEYFCPEHKTLYCYQCATSSTCKLDKIARVCKDIRSDEEFRKLQTNIEGLVQEASLLGISTSKMKTEVGEKGARDVDEVELFEQLMIKKLKTQSRNIKDDINIATSESQYQLQGVVDTCNVIRSVGEQLSKEFHESIDNEADVFISFVQSRPLLQSAIAELATAKDQAKPKHYSFKKSLELENALKKTTSFGSYEAEEDNPPAQSTDMTCLNAKIKQDDTSRCS